MNHLIKTITVFAILITLSTSLTAHNQDNILFKEKKPTFETLKDYNEYVKTIDFKELNAEDKLWLEEQYNELIKKVDMKFHNTKQATNNTKQHSDAQSITL